MTTTNMPSWINAVPPTSGGILYECDGLRIYRGHLGTKTVVDMAIPVNELFVRDGALWHQEPGGTNVLVAAP